MAVWGSAQAWGAASQWRLPLLLFRTLDTLNPERESPKQGHTMRSVS